MIASAVALVVGSARVGFCVRLHLTTERSITVRIRFISWLVIGILSAFLVVATASFSVSTIAWLAFAISIATGLTAAGIAYSCRHEIASFLLAGAAVLVSAWTVVASLVFSDSTVQNLSLASGLAVGALAVGGLVSQEVSLERAATGVQDDADQRGRLAAAA
jgi:hypothetical protein